MLILKYIVSYLNFKAHVYEDNCWLETMSILSNFHLAGALKTDPANVNTDNCCIDKAGAYIIGNMSEFDNDNLGEPKFDDLYKWGQYDLSKSQSDVGTFYADFNEQFLTQVFGYPVGCEATVLCYAECGYWSDCNDILPQMFLDIKNFNKEIIAEMNVYPNPSNGEILLLLNVSDNPNKNNEIRIFDNKGRVVAVYKNIKPNLDGSIYINLTSFPKNTYFVNYVVTPPKIIRQNYRKKTVIL